MRQSRLGAITVATTLLLTFLGLGGTAYADDVKNNVVAGGNDTVAVGSTTTVSFQIERTSDPGEPGSSAQCNLGGNRPSATLSVVGGAVSGTTPTVSPSSLVFSACNTPQEVTFSASKPGRYPISVSISPSTGFDVSAAAFTLTVTGNTAPTVSVVGPTQGASYEKGAVPAASCNVTDVQDGSSTRAATVSAVTGSLASYGLGSQTASCSYTDAGGLTASASATYSIVDTVAPTLTVPGDITREATSTAGAVASWTVSATDAVDAAPRTSCAPASGGTFSKGTTAVTCTATDVAGNQQTKTFNVSVQDTTLPTLTLPADVTVEATGPGGAPVTYSATASDTVDGALTPSCVPASGGIFALGTTPVNCSVTDSSANEGTGGFGVTVLDRTPPALTVPSSITTEATGPNGAAVEYTASASDIVDGAVAPTCTPASGATFGLGATTVSCTAADAAGNRDSMSFTVTVVDTTKPQLTLPEHFPQEATSAAGAVVTYTATAGDLVSGAVTAFCAPVSGSTFAFGSTTVTCTATDQAGNVQEGSFNVTVADTTAPALSDMPPSLTLEATGSTGAVGTYPAPTATDAVDAAPAVVCLPASGSTFPLGETTVSCTASDSRGNESDPQTFTVTVKDTTAPVVTVPDSQTVEATGPDGAIATWSGVSASDTVDGHLDTSCDAEPGALFPLGATVVSCTATDAAGNAGDESFTITVQDKSAPVVTVPENITREATGPSGATVSWSDVSAQDVVDGFMTAGCTPVSGSTFGIATTTVTCTATDKAANTGSGAFTVTVQDTTAPVVTVPSKEVVVEATSANGAVATWTASASDLVDGAVAPVCTPASGAVVGLGETTVTCTATDTRGNTGSASFTVRVRDTTAPAITVPRSVTTEAASANGAVVTYAATADDLVDGDTAVVCTPASGSTFALGSIEVTCESTDAAGNKASAKFTVTVQDTTAPVVNPLGNVAVKATSTSGASASYTATATDAVDGTVPASCTPVSGSTFAVGTTTVSCTAKDAAGNTSAAATFTVTVTFDKTAFLAPVDGNKVLNGMKAGSTAPLKWRISDGQGGWISDLSVVKSITAQQVTCDGGAFIDDLTDTATGGTTLRYDSTANQFVYNWQSPKKAGACYSVTVAFTDDTATTALFRLR